MTSRIFYLFFFIAFVYQINAQQLLSINQVTTFAVSSPDKIGQELIKAGWKSDGLEFVKDSNFVRRIWMIPSSRPDLKNYFIHYEFTNDTAENYVIYQYSDRKAFAKYKSDLKDLGYKHINGGKSRKKGKSKDEHIHKEKEDLYFDENRKTLTVVKEVFYYGLFSFLINSYKPNSKIANYTMSPTKK